MAVGRDLYRTIEYICDNSLSDSRVTQEKLDLYKARVNALESQLYPNKSVAKERTKYPASLAEIEHREYSYGHLTVMNDTLFKIF